MVSRTRRVISEDSSSIANATQRSKPCGPVMIARMSPAERIGRNPSFENVNFGTFFRTKKTLFSPIPTFSSWRWLRNQARSRRPPAQDQRQRREPPSFLRPGSMGDPCVARGRRGTDFTSARSTDAAYAEIRFLIA